jgi:hypothetical protein
MNKQFLLAAACAAAVSAAAVAAGPFDQFKGKMKEGMYETKMEMDMGQMPGMPAGMGKQAHTFQNCVTAEDIEKGKVGKGKDGKGMDNCEVKNFSMSGNTANYTTVCKSPEMTADSKITFTGDGYNMDMKMAMNRNGKAMNVTQHMESRYVGPCTKK